MVLRLSFEESLKYFEVGSSWSMPGAEVHPPQPPLPLPIGEYLLKRREIVMSLRGDAGSVNLPARTKRS